MLNFVPNHTSNNYASYSTGRLAFPLNKYSQCSWLCRKVFAKTSTIVNFLERARNHEFGPLGVAKYPSVFPDFPSFWFLFQVLLLLLTFASSSFIFTEFTVYVKINFSASIFDVTVSHKFPNWMLKGFCERLRQSAPFHVSIGGQSVHRPSIPLRAKLPTCRTSRH